MDYPGGFALTAPGVPHIVRGCGGGYRVDANEILGRDLALDNDHDGVVMGTQALVPTADGRFELPQHTENPQICTVRSARKSGAIPCDDNLVCQGFHGRTRG